MLAALALLFGLAAPVSGWDAVLPLVLAAALGACGTELVASRLRRRRWHTPTGALITGVLIALVLSPQEPLYVPLVGGVLAVASRHVLRARWGHVFNPAALALLVAVVVFGSAESWWGALAELPWPWVVVLLTAAFAVANRVNKLPLALVFCGAYFGLFTAVSFANPALVAEMFRGPFVHAALFLGAFMATDPPTSPTLVRDQLWFGSLVAAVCVATQVLGAGQSYLLLGLLAGNGCLFVVTWRRMRVARLKRYRQAALQPA